MICLREDTKSGCLGIYQNSMQVPVQWLEDSLASFFSASLQGATRLFVGFSGGVDSTALLLLCQAYAKLHPHVQVHAIHVNHNLHPDAVQWQSHCQSVCDRLGIPLILYTVDVDTTTGRGIEDAARAQRWACFNKALKNHPRTCLLLAHHAQDQSETVLMRLCQGTGLHGMLGIRPASQQSGMRVLRPLLAYDKATCMDYVRSRSLAWVEDASNQDSRLTRGFIRVSAMPHLQQRWPEVQHTIARQSFAWQDELEGLHACVEGFLADLVQDYTGLAHISLVSLCQLPQSAQRMLLKSWILQHGWYACARRRLDTLLGQLNNARPGSSAQLVTDQYALCLSRNKLFLLPRTLYDAFASANVTMPINWKIDSERLIIITALSRWELVFNSPAICARVQQVSTSSHICSSSPKMMTSVKIKKHYHQFDVPKFLRQNLPWIIFDGKQCHITALCRSGAQYGLKGYSVSWMGSCLSPDTIST